MQMEVSECHHTYARCPDKIFPGFTVWNKNILMPFQIEFFRPLTLKSHIFLFL